MLLLLLSLFLVERQVDGFQKEIKSPYCRQGRNVTIISAYYMVLGKWFNPAQYSMPYIKEFEREYSTTSL